MRESGTDRESGLTKVVWCASITSLNWLHIEGGLDMAMDQETVIRRHGRNISSGTVIFREKDPADELFIIQQGQVRILKKLGKEELCVAVLQDGDFFGEEAFEGSPRSVTAQASTDVLAVVVDRKTFQRITDESGEVSRRIIMQLCQRLQDSYGRLARVVLHDEFIRVARVLLELAEEGQANAEGQVFFDRDWLQLMASRAGLSPARVLQWKALMRNARVLGIGEDGRFWLAASSNLEEFVEYCELKQRFDPLMPGDLAGWTGMVPGEIEVLASRVARRLVGRQDLTGCDPERLIATPYIRYLILKLRFEVQARTPEDMENLTHDGERDHEGSL